MLINQPSYSNYVADYSLKSSIILGAYTRQTFYWNLECELNGTMSRKTASSYYDQTFKDPSKVESVKRPSLTLIITDTTVLVSLVMMFFVLLVMRCKDSSALEALEGQSGCNCLAALVIPVFISWLVTIPIVFRRYNAAYDVVLYN